MAYFLSCQMVQTYPVGDEPHLYTFTGPCLRTGEIVSVELYGPHLFQFHKGMPIQKAFPYIDAWSREWMLTGRTGYNMDPEDEPDWDVPVSRLYMEV